MSSLFRSIRDREREAQARLALTANLSECVKAIQFNHQAQDRTHQTVENSDLSTSLCMAVEAIFLHGLKDTLLRKARNAFIIDVDHKPQPAFWPLLLIISHKDNIEQINSLQQITTEIGQCRAWVRIALNESLLSSYLHSIMRNMNASKHYYNHSAFIRDSEQLDVVHRLLEGMESCSWFQLPINSSLLNTWPEDVLMLAGIWTPTMKSCPIASGVDVASTLTASEPEDPMYIPGRGPNSGLGQMLSINPDDALNFILSNTPEDFMDNMKDNEQIEREEKQAAEEKSEQTDTQQEVKNESIDTKEELSSPDDENDKIIVEYDESEIKPDIVGNAITKKTAWSSHFNEFVKLSPVNSQNSSPDSKSLTSVDEIAAPNPYDKPPDIHKVIQGLHKELKITIEDREPQQFIPATASPLTPDDPLLNVLGFEVVSNTPSAHFDSEELQTMMSRIGTLSREYGLDTQDYECLTCRDTLGTSLSKARVCKYSGQYFCSNCMDPNVFIIPSRVVHNWDFHRYPVSKRSALFLLEFQNQPLINIKTINPLIYSAINEMTQLQSLRIQLNFLRAYLFTCREPIVEDLQKRVWPREYLYEHVHIYSISDLAQISNGSLASQLQKIITFAQNHVKDCWLCSQKGFICEVCNDSKILYPFDVDSTYRCEACSNVFHAKCLSPYKPCPKCERKKKRQGSTLVDAVRNNFQ